MAVNKILLYISVSFVGLIFCAWFLFYNKAISNDPLVINLRNFYFTQLDKITPRHFFIYSIRPYFDDKNGYFIYKFPGKFQSIDFENSTILLKDLNDNEWKFKYYTNKNPNLADDLSSDELIFRMDTVKKDNSFMTQIYRIVIDTQDFRNNDQIFSKDDTIVIYWRDNRKLQDVINASKLGEVIEMNPANMIQIQKIVWE